MTCSHTFSRAWRRLHVFASSSDWFIGLSACVVVGQSYYFCFGLTILSCPTLFFRSRPYSYPKKAEISKKFGKNVRITFGQCFEKDRKKCSYNLRTVFRKSSEKMFV